MKRKIAATLLVVFGLGLVIFGMYGCIFGLWLVGILVVLSGIVFCVSGIEVARGASASEAFDLIRWVI